MALQKCHECRNEVSTDAKACPKCGAKVKKPTSKTALVVAGIFALLIFGSITRNNSGPTAEARKLTTNEQLDLDKQAAAQRAADQVKWKADCVAQLDDKKKQYAQLMKQKRFLEAAGTVRSCANLLEDASLRQLTADAEIRSYTETINSPKASLRQKIQSMEDMARSYPDKGKQYESQIPLFKARLAKSEAAADAARRKKEGVDLGMTPEEAIASSWGKPNSINRSHGRWGTHEQWVYDGGYLYFENGKLTSIQN